MDPYATHKDPYKDPYGSWPRAAGGAPGRPSPLLHFHRAFSTTTYSTDQNYFQLIINQRAEDRGKSENCEKVNPLFNLIIAPSGKLKKVIAIPVILAFFVDVFSA